MRHIPFWKNSRLHSRQPKRKTASRGRRAHLGASSLGVERLEDRRMLAAGDLDTMFGTGGQVVQDLGIGKQEQIFASAVQVDGKIVVAGFAINVGGSGSDFLVARLIRNCTLDIIIYSGVRSIMTVSLPSTDL